MKLILASSSPRRKELLSACGFKFEIIVANCDETPIQGESPQAMVERLALMKAAVVADLHRDATVIGADTTVFIDDQILGKPESVEDAIRILSLISGRVHTVWGGIAILNRDRNQEIVQSFCTSVKMSMISQDEIRNYIGTGEPMDKAGAYAIQGIGSQFVEEIVGSYSNVVGLNIAAVAKILRKIVQG